MRLDAARLYLRPLGPEDVTAASVAWLNDPGLNRYLDTRQDRHTLETAAATIAAVNAHEDEHLFGIFLAADDRPIGVIKLGPVHSVHEVGDVAVLIGDREQWGHGYATEAIARLVTHAFHDLEMMKLSASLHAANVACERAFLKAGFEREGLRRAHYDLDGVRSDVIELGLVSLRPRRRWRLK